jgi:hypothetical protein
VNKKHIEWFKVGARAFRAVARERGKEDLLPTSEDWYIRPLCLDAIFTIEELTTNELTVEHVPPKALGGAELVLTCRKCNNYAGSKFDAEAHKEYRIRQFFMGESVEPETATFTLDGFTSRGEMHILGSTGVYFTEVPRINNPAQLERMKEHMHELSEAGSVDFRFAATPSLKYFPDRARVSWVRTAYLAAFALLGWRYVIRRTLSPIREQLANPSDVTLPVLSVYDPNGDIKRRELWIAGQADGCQVLLVIIGQNIIFLPSWDDSRTLGELADSLGSESEGPIRPEFFGRMLPWPSRPLHLLDPPPIVGTNS